VRRHGVLISACAGSKNSPGANFDNGSAVGPEGVEGRKPGTILPLEPIEWNQVKKIDGGCIFTTSDTV